MIDPNEIYVSSSCPRVITHYLLEQGASTRDIERCLEQPLKQLDSADFRLSIARYKALWNFALNYTHQPDLGLILGQRKDEDEMGLVSHIFFSNGTIEQALEQYQRYFSFTNESLSLAIDIDKEKVHLQFQCENAELYCVQDIERTITIGLTRAKHQLGKDLKIHRVNFQHAAPAYRGSYDKVFNCPVHFSQSSSGFVFDAKYLATRLPHQSSYLQKVLSKHLDSVLTKVGGQKVFTKRVESLIEKRLSKESIDADHIAKKLNMSRNTLYRKLKSEDVAFHDVIDRVRQRKAMVYLEDHSYTLSQIAFLLGFSELSAFSRAFKRWTGKSPNQYLKSISED